MNDPDRDRSLDDQLAARLLECDEALAAGRVPEALDNSEPHELRIRLQRGLACIHILQELRPRQDAAPAEAATRNGSPRLTAVADQIDESFRPVASPIARVLKWTRRRPALAAALGALVLATGLCLAVMFR